MTIRASFIGVIVALAVTGVCAAEKGGEPPAVEAVKPALKVVPPAVVAPLPEQAIQPSAPAHEADKGAPLEKSPKLRGTPELVVSQPALKTASIETGATLSPMTVVVMNRGKAAASGYGLRIFLREKGGHETTLKTLRGSPLKPGDRHAHRNLLLGIGPQQSAGGYAVCARVKWNASVAEACRTAPLRVVVKAAPAVTLTRPPSPLAADVAPTPSAQALHAPKGVIAPLTVPTPAEEAKPRSAPIPGGQAVMPKPPAPAGALTPRSAELGQAVQTPASEQAERSAFGAKAQQWKQGGKAPAGPGGTARFGLVGGDILRVNGSIGPELSLPAGAAVDASWPGSRAFAEAAGEELRNHWLVVSDRMLAVNSCTVSADSDLPNDPAIDGDGRYGAGTTMRNLGGLVPGRTYYIKVCLQTRHPGWVPDTAWRHESNQVAVHYGGAVAVVPGGPIVAPHEGVVAQDPDLVVHEIQLSRDPDDRGRLLIRFKDANTARPFRQWYEARQAALRAAGQPHGLADVYPFRYRVAVDGSTVSGAGGTSYLPPSGQKHELTMGFTLPPGPHTVTVVVEAVRDGDDRNLANNSLSRRLDNRPPLVRVTVSGMGDLQVVYDGDETGGGELKNLSIALFEQGAGSTNDDGVQFSYGEVQNLSRRSLYGGGAPSWRPIENGDRLRVALGRSLQIDMPPEGAAVLTIWGDEDDSPCLEALAEGCDARGYWQAVLNLADRPIGEECRDGANVIDLATTRGTWGPERDRGPVIRPISGTVCLTWAD